MIIFLMIQKTERFGWLSPEEHFFGIDQSCYEGSALYLQNGMANNVLNHNSQVCRATETRSKPSIKETNQHGNSVALYDSNLTSAQVHHSKTTTHQQSKLCSSSIGSNNKVSQKVNGTDNFVHGNVDNGFSNR